MLAKAQLLGIDLLAIGTQQADGAVTLDWAALAEAIEAKEAEEAEDV